MSKTLENILIIDDDEISNFITVSILEQSKRVKNIATAMSADEGMQYLIKHNGKAGMPQVILLDIKMPVKSGWDFLTDYIDNVVIDKSNITIIMLSSSVYPDDVHKSKSYKEVAGYLSKPITLQKVDQIFEEYI
jgi:response regulator of citrate/malate metabolism